MPRDEDTSAAFPSGPDAEPSEAPSPPVSSALQPAAVLIVDDDATVLRMVRDYLSRRGFRVLEAPNGFDALERARRDQPDIILMDAMMPAMDGFETCRRLHQDSATSDIPVIFMTALTDAQSRVKSFRVGAVDYISKPIHYAELLARMDNHLQTRRLRGELEARNAALEAEIVQRKCAETTLQQHIAKLEESNAELEAFARTVAHDLREPLTAIIGFSQLVLEHELSPEVQESMRYILRTGYKMSDITRELLLMARVRDAEVMLEPVAMAEVVKNSRERLAYAIDESHAQIVTADDWPPGMGYGPWIEEVWVNYLSNAIKYGGKPPRVELGATPEDDGYVRYWIRDNGPGIPEEERAMLFTEFTRLDNARTKGHGLGLSIVRRIIEKLGGRVGVESAAGQGSTFYFALRKAEAAA